jgi:hypothetical protein
VHVVSFGWQTSVERITRLHHLEVARPAGEAKALAWRKSVALPDAEHGWVEGELVRIMRDSKQSRVYDLHASACRFSIRRKAFSDSLPRLALTSEAKQGPLARR